MAAEAVMEGTTMATGAVDQPTQVLTASSSSSSILGGFLELCPTIDGVQSLLRSTLSTEAKIKKLSQVVLRAASNGDTDLLTWLIQTARSHPVLAAIHIPSVREEDGSAMGPVSLAASAGHVDAVRILVDHGADVDETDTAGWTPLMWAVNSSNLPLTSYLLRKGANVEARTHSGFTCEDFIVSVAPDEDENDIEGASRDVGGPSSRKEPLPASPCSKDRELIADTIYEHLQMALQRRSLHGEAFGSNFSMSPMPSRSGPESQFSASGPGTPFQQRDPTVPSTGTSTPASRHSRSTSHTNFSAPHSTSSTSRRLAGRTERSRMHEIDLRQREVAEGRRRALLDVATFLEADFTALLGESPGANTNSLALTSSSRPSWAVKKKNGLRRRDHGNQSRHYTANLSPGCGALEVGSDSLSNEFDFEQILPHQMMVFGEADIDPLLEMLVAQRRPVRAPWTARAEPANIVYLCLRFAASVKDEDLLASLLYAMLERVEDTSRAHEADLVHQSYWLFNLTLLLHYTKKDAVLASLHKMRDEYQLYLQDLINEVYVAIIRDTERRISKVLEPAMFEHASIPGFEEIRFEGDWNFMKTLAGSVKGPSASLRDSPASSTSGSTRRPLSQIFAQWKDNRDDNSGSTALRPSLLNDAAKIPAGRSASGSPRSKPDSLASSPIIRPSLLGDGVRGAPNVDATEQLKNPTPATVTALLTSALHVMQLYEINPSTIIQAFSQVIFWVGSELFNKTLTQKKHLCRSKAMQLKLNISALEDWAKNNALPLSIVTTHLAPASQLISWLSCQSSLTTFDSLIGTLQGLRSLNPRQMKRAVRDYRYEVGEARMSDECLQYLDQLTSDWDRRQEQAREVEEEKKARKELDEMRKALVKADQEAAIRSKARLDSDGGNETRRSGTIKANRSEERNQHHRSGTATQDGPNPDSRPLTPELVDEEPVPASSSDAYDATNASMTSTGTARQVSNTSLGLGLDVEGSAHEVPEDHELPDEVDSQNASEDEDSQAAQSLIDSLFLPGNSMADYLPPTAPSTSPTTASGKPRSVELLHSSSMLPFALPSSTAALIVSPGDAFGFGRGHFAGTGTPSLRDVRGSSTGLPASLSSSTIRAGPRSSEDELRSETDVSSVVSGLSSSACSATSGTGSLFATGKGFSAGAYWQPVPLVREESLDAILQMMRREAKTSLALMMQRRRNATALLGLYSGVGTTVDQRSSRRPGAMVHGAVANENGSDQHEDEPHLLTSPIPASPSRPHHASSSMPVSVPVGRHLSVPSPPGMNAMPPPRNSSVFALHDQIDQQTGNADRAKMGSRSPSPRVPHAPLSPRKHLAALLPSTSADQRSVSGLSSKHTRLALPINSPTMTNAQLDQA